MKSVSSNTDGKETDKERRVRGGNQIGEKMVAVCRWVFLCLVKVYVKKMSTGD